MVLSGYPGTARRHFILLVYLLVYLVAYCLLLVLVIEHGSFSLDIHANSRGVWCISQSPVTSAQASVLSSVRSGPEP